MAARLDTHSVGINYHGTQLVQLDGLTVDVKDISALLGVGGLVLDGERSLVFLGHGGGRVGGCRN